MFSRALLAAASCAAAATLTTAVPAHAASPIQLGKIQYDSPGTDSRSNASLNAEYVVIKNTGTTSRALTGWTLRDTANHVYKFGTFTLGAGRTVVVRTGKGTNTASTRYWGMGNYVWNNTGDKAYLRASNGTSIDSCAWTAKGAGYKNC
jgi:hypothetical protein